MGTSVHAVHQHWRAATTVAGTVGFTDVDNNGWDDLVIFDEGHDVVVEFQGPEGFHAVEMATLSSINQWGACIGDLDNSGTKDLLSGGSMTGCTTSAWAHGRSAIR